MMTLLRFVDVLEESAVESQVSVKETIERLRTMRGGCRHQDTDGFGLVFDCDRKGRIRVGDPIDRGRYRNYDRSYYVVGEVVSENEKTVVKMYGVRQRGTKFWAWVELLMYAVFVIGYITVKLLYDIPFALQDGLVILFLGGISGMVFYRLHREVKNLDADFGIMKQEIINRVDAVNRWDE